MNKQDIVDQELSGFLHLLEEERLLILTAIVMNPKGYDIEDLQKLALHGSAIESVKDAIAYKKLL
jgi:hypothetical protein